MHREPRGANKILLAVAHTNEGPEGVNSAAGLVHYLDQIDGGYQVVVDNKSLVRAARDDEIVWGASGANTHGVHGCFIGFAAQSRQDWLDVYSRGELNLMAAQFAQWHLDRGMPIRYVDENALRDPNATGFTSHFAVERSGRPKTGGKNGHTDPGVFFPWDVFLPLVELAAGKTDHLPPIPATPEALLTTIAIKKGDNPGIASPVPALGVVLLENDARIAGDKPVNGNTRNHTWRHPAVPANAKLIDIVDLRPLGEQRIASKWDLGDGLTHLYRGDIVAA